MEDDYLTGLRKHIEDVRKDNLEYKEYLKESRSRIDKILGGKTVAELMQFLDNGIKNMKYLSKDRQHENNSDNGNVINLQDYKDGKSFK